MRDDFNDSLTHPHESAILPHVSLRLIEGLKSFVGGGLAGAVAKTFVAPLDRVKIMYQVTHHSYTFKGAVRTMRDMVNSHGFSGLFHGNGATLARIVPYAGLELMSFDQLKQSVEPEGEDGRLSCWQRLLCGSGAGAIAVTLTYPLDMIRARMALQFHTREYLNWRHAMKVIYRQEGFTALFAGMSSAIIGIVPYSGISFLTFDTLKHKVKNRANRNPTSFELMICGGLAGLVGQTLTYPLDTIRRRMQTESFLHTQNFGHGLERRKSKTFFNTIRCLLEEDRSGKIFFKGVTLVWIKGPIASGVAYSTFDFMKKAFGVHVRDI